MLEYALSKIKEILQIKRKTFVILSIEQRYCFGTSGDTGCPKEVTEF